MQYPSTSLGVCLASDWQLRQPGEQRRGEVPLGPILPAVAFRGLLWGFGLFSRESGSGLWGLELLWPPLASAFPKVPWPRLHDDSWVQIRGRGGQQGQVRLWAGKPSGAALGRSVPAGEVSAPSGRSTFCPVPPTTARGLCSSHGPSLSLAQALWARILVSLTWLLQPLALGASGLL